MPLCIYPRYYVYTLLWVDSKVLLNYWEQPSPSLLASFSNIHWTLTVSLAWWSFLIIFVTAAYATIEEICKEDTDEDREITSVPVWAKGNHDHAKSHQVTLSSQTLFSSQKTCGQVALVKFILYLWANQLSMTWLSDPVLQGPMGYVLRTVWQFKGSEWWFPAIAYLLTLSFHVMGAKSLHLVILNSKKNSFLRKK